MATRWFTSIHSSMRSMSEFFCVTFMYVSDACVKGCALVFTFIVIVSVLEQPHISVQPMCAAATAKERNNRNNME